ncbi:MAG: type IV secretion system DNA-binding domain-containing protein [Bacteroidia bacterium]|nr:type IV secretion system DNA-binding domain-containing protein [Bacteroidia bacterium]
MKGLNLEISLAKLAEKILELFSQKQSEHMLLVRHLSKPNAESLWQKLHELKSNFRYKKEVEIFILASSDVSLDHRYIRPDKAIEKRDAEGKDALSLCLLVPSNTYVPDSLTNAFDTLDTRKLLEQIKEELIEGLNKEQQAVRQTLDFIQKKTQLKQKVLIEAQLSYIEAIIGAIKQNPQEPLGKELWRLSLLPDYREDYTRYLSENYEVAKKFSNYKKSLIETIEELKLVQDYSQKLYQKLQSHLQEGNSLTDFSVFDDSIFHFGAWQRQEHASHENLQIQVKLLQPTLSKVQRNTAIELDNHTLTCKLPTKKKIKVEWEVLEGSLPGNCFWRVALVSEDYKDQRIEESIFYDNRKIKPNKKSFSIDTSKIEAETSSFKAVVLVQALDPQGKEIYRNIQNQQKEIVEDFSPVIYFTIDEELEGELEEEVKPLGKFHNNLPLAYLLSFQSSSLKEWIFSIPALEVSKETDNFKLTQNIGQGKYVYKAQLIISKFGSAIEKFVISNPEKIIILEPCCVTAIPLPDNGKPQFQFGSFHVSESLQNERVYLNFLEKRKKLFNYLASLELKLENEAIFSVAALTWLNQEYKLDRALISLCQEYASSYSALLEFCSLNNYFNALPYLLRIDTIELIIDYPYGKRNALLLLPTHPWRMLWLAEYASLFIDWAQSEYQLNIDGKLKPLYSLELEKGGAVWQFLVPDNTPPLLPFLEDTPSKASYYFYYRTLGFFYGLLLPIEQSDAETLADDIERLLGFDKQAKFIERLEKSTLQQILQEYFENYGKILSQRGLKVGTIYDGSGTLLTELLEAIAFKSKIADKKEEQEEELKVPRICIDCFLPSPLPFTLTNYKDFSKTFYETEGKDSKASNLLPAFQVNLHTYDKDKLIEDNIIFPFSEHLILQYSWITPEVDFVELPQASQIQAYEHFNGLLSRWQKINFQDQAGYLRTSIVPNFMLISISSSSESSSLLKTAQIFYHSFSRWAYWIEYRSTLRSGSILCLSTMLSPQEIDFLQKRLIKAADQTIFISPFSAHELLDTPQENEILVRYIPRPYEGVSSTISVFYNFKPIFYTKILQELKNNNIINPKTLTISAAHQQLAVQVVKILKILSPSHLFDILYSDSQDAVRKSMNVFSALCYLLQQGKLNGAILFPLKDNKDYFKWNTITEENTVAPYLCDFLILRYKNPNHPYLEVECVVCADENDKYDFEEKLAHGLLKFERFMRQEYLGENEEGIGYAEVSVNFRKKMLISLWQQYLLRAMRYNLVSHTDALLFERAFYALLQMSPTFALSIYCRTHRTRENRDILERVSIYYSQPSFYCEFPRVNVSLQPAIVSEESVSIEDAINLSESRVSNIGLSQDISSVALSSQDIAPELSLETTVQDSFAQEPLSSSPVPSSSDLGRISQKEPVEVSSTSTKIKILLGEIDLQNKPIYWEPSTKGSPSILILGAPGQGKTVCLKHMLLQLKKAGVSTLVLDYHQSFCNENTEFFQKFQPTVWNPLEEGLPFSPLEVSPNYFEKPNLLTEHCQKLVSIFKEVCGLGDQQYTRLKKVIKELYQTHRRTITFAELQGELSKQGYEDIANRLDDFFEYELFRATGEIGFDWKQACQDGLVINLQQIASQERLVRYFCAFLIHNIYLHFMQKQESSQLHFFLVLDEAHKLGQLPTLTQILKELRKFGVGTILASQEKDDFADSIHRIVGAKVAFHLGASAAKEVASLFTTNKIEKERIQQQIERLEVGKAIIQIASANAYRVNMLEDDFSQY